MTALKPVNTDIKKHLTFLFGTLNDYSDGVIEIAHTPPHSSAINLCEKFQQYEINEAVEYAEKINSIDGQNVYVVASLLNPDGSVGRALDQDAYVTPCAWVDIDEEFNPAELKEKYKDAPPALVVITGREPHLRAHLWWKYLEPEIDADVIREANGNLVGFFGGDRAATNPARLMRLGGTVAWPKKKGRIAEHVTVQELGNGRPVMPEALIQRFKSSDVGGVIANNNTDVSANIMGVTDGREKYMSDMVCATIINMTAQKGDWVTEQEVFNDAWPVYSREVATKVKGATLDQEGRGQKEMQHKIRAKLRSFKLGRVRGAETLEKIVAQKKPSREPKKDATLYKPPTTANEELNGERKKLDMRDWFAANHLLGQAAPISWLNNGIFPLGVPCLLAAMGGLGKSFISLDLCLEVAAPSPIQRKSILGGEVEATGKAVLITAEDNMQSIHRRVNQITDDARIMRARENLIVIPMPELGGHELLVTEGQEGLKVTEFFEEIREQLIEMDDVKLVIIDPLQAFVGADITAKPEAAQFMWSAFANIAAHTGCTFLCTHHMRKDGQHSIKSAGEAREAIRGSSGIIDGARRAYALWPMSDQDGAAIAHEYNKEFEPYRFVQGAVVKTNDIANQDIMTYYREDTGLLECMGIVDVKAIAPSIDKEVEKVVFSTIQKAWDTGKPYGLNWQNPLCLSRLLKTKCGLKKKDAQYVIDGWMLPYDDKEPSIIEDVYEDDCGRKKKGIKLNPSHNKGVKTYE